MENPALSDMLPGGRAVVAAAKTQAKISGDPEKIQRNIRKTKQEDTEMFERIDYEVARIDGDYAYLWRLDGSEAEEKCVARALLSPEITEGSQVIYEMLEYRMA